MFDALADADRALRAMDLATVVGSPDPMVAHSFLKGLRAKGIRVYRYRDPDGDGHSQSLYALAPVEGLIEIAAPSTTRGARRHSEPPTPVRPQVRQPAVGSVVRITAVVLDGEELRTRFDCDGTAYQGRAKTTPPVVGQWMTLVTVGLHGQGLYVDLADTQVVTLEDLTEVVDG